MHTKWCFILVVIIYFTHSHTQSHGRKPYFKETNESNVGSSSLTPTTSRFENHARVHCGELFVFFTVEFFDVYRLEDSHMNATAAVLALAALPPVLAEATAAAVLAPAALPPMLAEAAAAAVLALAALPHVLTFLVHHARVRTLGPTA